MRKILLVIGVLVAVIARADSIFGVSPVFVVDLQMEVDISGRVLDEEKRAPLDGVSIEIGGRSAKTGADGTFSLKKVRLALGNMLAASKDDYATHHETVPAPPGAKAVTLPDIQLRPKGFKITKLEGEYDGLFLEEVPLKNTFTASVNWDDETPGSVEFTVNGKVRQTVAASGDQVSLEINMGEGFKGASYKDANRVEAVAITAKGTRSKVFSKSVSFIPTPNILLKLIGSASYAIFNKDDPVISFDVQFPDEKIPSSALKDMKFIGRFGMQNAVGGGIEYALKSGAWNLHAGYTPNGRWAGRVGQRPHSMLTKPKVYVGNREIGFEVAGEIGGTATQTDGIMLGELGIHISVDYQQEILTFYLSDYMPGTQWMRVLDWTKGVGIDPNSFQRVRVYGLLDAEFDLCSTYAQQVFRFKNGTIALGLGVEAAYEPNLGIASARIYVGGQVKPEFRIAPDFGFNKLTAKAYGGLSVTALSFKVLDAQFALLNYSWPSAAGLSLLPLALDAGDGWIIVPVKSAGGALMDRDYLKMGGEVFVAGSSSGKTILAFNADAAVSGLDAFRLMGQAPARGSVGTGTEAERANGASALSVQPSVALQQADVALVENVFPYGGPSLAGRNGELMLLYAGDNGSPNALQCTDIRWTRWDGMSWSTPASILADTRAEFSPQVAFDGKGDAIAVWERAADPAFVTEDLTAMAAQMEIVWSRWDRMSGTWSEPQGLTDNRILDHAPLLCGPAEDGSVLAVWTRNQVNLMTGTNGAPDQVLTAKWNPAAGGWSAEQTLLAAVTNRLSQSLACSTNGYAVYGWTDDADGVLTNDVDQEVFVCERQGGAWGRGEQLTTNAVPDKCVRVAVGPDDTFIAVWQQGADLVIRRGGTGATAVVRADSQSTGFADFALTRGPAGNLVLLWQEMTENGSDAHYMVYDPVSATWGRDALLCSDTPLERAFAPVWDNLGNLTVAYDKVQVDKVTKTVELEDGGTVAIDNVPQPGQVDLCVTKRALVRDLVIRTGDFTANGANFLPGDAVTLSAVVRNAGDVAVSNAVVGFYDGDPDAGGTLISNAVFSGWFEGSATNVVQALWVVPEPATNHTLVTVIDRDGRASEFDPDNNAQSLAVGGTDLTVSLVSYAAETNGAVRVYAQVRNAGAPGATNTVLTIRKCDALGTPAAGAALATVDVPALEPGRLAQVALDLPVGTQPEGDAFYQLRADEANTVADIETNNNLAAFSANLCIDTDGDGMSDGWETKYGLSKTDPSDTASDTDHDGLTALEEYRNGTRPDLDDTDGDGMKDGAEVAAGTDPLSIDSLLRITHVGARMAVASQNYLPLAFQSVSNKAYVIQIALAVTGAWLTVSEPFVAVSNRTQVLVRMLESMPQAFYRVQTSTPLMAYTYTLGFSLPDQWIGQYDWSALPAQAQSLRNAADDPDGDGMDNQSEMAAGTDPTDAASCLRITSFNMLNGTLSGGIQTATGRVYYVESCLPGDTAWKPVTGLIGGQAGITPWQVTRPPEAGAGFYRAVLGVPSDMTKVQP